MDKNRKLIEKIMDILEHADQEVLRLIYIVLRSMTE